MIKYLCENCNGMESESSTCPVCARDLPVYQIELFYCNKCQTPVWESTCNLCESKTKYIGIDVRPVFPEERLLIECIENKPFKYVDSAIWALPGLTYLIDGVKKRISNSDFDSVDTKMINKLLAENEQENQQYVDSFMNTLHIQNFIEANRLHLLKIENEAQRFVIQTSQKFDISEMFVSFSGGKDSTVTSHIVMSALSRNDIVHLYGDTTLEYPMSLEYIKIFRKENPKVPMLVAKNKEQNFEELCQVIGPPSRVMRWCCTVFKTGAITRKIDSVFKNMNKVLVWYGIRRNESASRSKYERISEGKKITKQLTASPIIDWLDFDVWLYLLSHNISFNTAYRKGFQRVGCWCCPNNSKHSEYLAKVYMPQEYDRFRDMLLDFAKGVGKPDYEEYVDGGGWKARQGGNGLKNTDTVVLDFKPCVLEESAYNFELNKPLSDMFYELFKPFGVLDFDLGNERLGEVFVLEKGTHSPLLKITGKLGRKTVKVTVLKNNKMFSNERRNEQLIKSQVMKFQACIGCMGCESVCKYGALHLRISHDEQGNIKPIYKINEKKCTSCLECVTHFTSGCLMKKVLRTKENFK